VQFEGDIAAFDPACIKGIRESLEDCDLAGNDCTPFRTLVAVELEGTYPDTAIVVTYRYKAAVHADTGDLRAIWPIWTEPGEHSVFKPMFPSSDEMWSDAGELLVYIWFIEPEGPDLRAEPDLRRAADRPGGGQGSQEVDLGVAEGDGARLASQRRTAAGRLMLGSTCR
jgi:hypothetical protein